MMGLGLIEKDNRRVEEPGELLLMEDQVMIQAFAPHTSLNDLTRFCGSSATSVLLSSGNQDALAEQLKAAPPIRGVFTEVSLFHTFVLAERSCEGLSTHLSWTDVVANG
jgi:hypothetical protein